MLNLFFKVGSHEKCASRCCSLVDELRDRKGELCDKVKTYFIEYKEKIKQHEDQLLQEVLKWYDKQFELIKHAQKKEERRIEKVRFTKLTGNICLEMEYVPFKTRAGMLYRI